MRRNRDSKQAKRRSRPTTPSRPSPNSTSFDSRPDPSPARSRQSIPATSATSLIDGDIVTEQGATVTSSSIFEDLEINNFSSPEPRSFPYSVKQQCWDKAEKVKGRDPDRWRRDSLGNMVFRKLVGCPGCLCHDYDHIVPYSKGGKSTLENCQVLQAIVNRSKGNRTELSKADLIQKSSYCRVSGRDMDLLEMTAYGNVRRALDSGGCRIQ